MMKIHGSSIAIEGRGILLCGTSGAGKSDLALRLIDGGAMLIADDYTELHKIGGRFLLAPPQEIAGRLEVRGLGLMRLPHVSDIPLNLVFDLMPYNEIARMPDATPAEFEGLFVPRRQLDPFMASAAAIVRLAALQNPLRTGYE
ncbi:HPr kinase/phosphorylase [Sneathiella sp.]|uniref:HPr kinase/phosphorylase n=1 Tax=Sneathiella sp. TaxID=1964365 RepID=UPI0035674640